MSLRTIKERVEAATPGPWRKRLPGWLGPDRHKYGCVFFGPSPDEMYTTSPLTPTDAVFIAHARTDIPALLRVAEAAAEAELFCSDLCPAHYDEPCTCGRAVLRAALADLEALP